MASSTRKSIPDPVTNRLFALSGNQCAFPSCTNAVTDQVTPGEQPVTLAQRAHIVGVGRQGPRSKAAPLSDDIDSVENLLLLCGEHHRIVDNNPRIYSVEVLAKYKADHEAKMAPKLRPVPPPLETDTVDLSLLPVSDLPSALWRAKSQFRTAAEVGEHLPRSKGEQALPFVLLKSEIWAFHNLADARGPFKQVVDPKTAQQLHAGSVLKSDDRNIYAWLLNGALRQSLIRRVFALTVPTIGTTSCRIMRRSPAGSKPELRRGERSRRRRWSGRTARARTTGETTFCRSLSNRPPRNCPPSPPTGVSRQLRDRQVTRPAVIAPKAAPLPRTTSCSVVLRSSPSTGP